MNCLAYVRKQHGEKPMADDKSASLVANCWTTMPAARIVLDAMINDVRVSFQMNVKQAKEIVRELQAAIKAHYAAMKSKSL